jgi:hypothetical protein
MSELGPEAREILRNGRDGDNPSPADRARIHSALMAAIAAGAVTTVAGQASASSTSVVAELGLPASVGAAKPIATSLVGTVFGKGLLVLFFGAAGTGALLAWPSSNSVHAPVQPRVMANPADSMVKAPLPPPSASPQEPRSESPADAPAIAPAPVFSAKPLPVRASASAQGPKTTEETADSLVAETQRLREAHGALRGGDPEKALALLSEQAAEVEGQKLREERAAARVLVLCKLGRVDEANAEAAAFLTQNPRSPLADRVRHACPSSR